MFDRIRELIMVKFKQKYFDRIRELIMVRCLIGYQKKFSTICYEIRIFHLINANKCKR
jgi:hypothetical protein